MELETKFQKSSFSSFPEFLNQTKQNSKFEKNKLIFPLKWTNPERIHLFNAVRVASLDLNFAKRQTH